MTRGKESTCQAGVSYPLWVALGKDSVCTGICQIDQEGAAWQRGQAVFDGEVHSCLQGLSIPSQHLSVTFPLSAGRKETDGGVRGFSVCHLEADGKMRTCHSSVSLHLSTACLAMLTTSIHICFMRQDLTATFLRGGAVQGSFGYMSCLTRDKTGPSSQSTREFPTAAYF